MAKPSDLKGRRFGALYVLEPAQAIVYRSGRLQSAWLCECDCGKRAIVATNNLASGNTNSCGCRKRAPHRRKGLLGVRFGRLTVLGYARTTARGQAIWVCACDCGGSVECRATSLLRGKVKSCGCYRREGRFHRGLGPVKWARMVKGGYSCLRCSSTDRLHAHHIIPVSAAPELARSMFNGECMCERCHVEFHRIYGKETAGLDDFAEFCALGEAESRVLRTLIFSKGRQDIEKAIHELQLLLEFRYGEQA